MGLTYCITLVEFYSVSVATGWDALTEPHNRTVQRSVQRCLQPPTGKFGGPSFLVFKFWDSGLSMHLCACFVCPVINYLAVVCKHSHKKMKQIFSQKSRIHICTFHKWALKRDSENACQWQTSSLKNPAFNTNIWLANQMQDRFLLNS